LGGWFKAGDIGNLDEDGFLSVTDRKKDLLKTSGGKFIAPQPVENSLKLNAMIGTAVVLGDRRKFASVIISPAFPVLEEWARTHHISFSSREELVANPKVQALYKGIVGEVWTGSLRDAQENTAGARRVQRNRRHSYSDAETSPQGRRRTLSRTDRRTLSRSGDFGRGVRTKSD
jgi:long-subunit acyl-CoA synthetase (AMP-forming)